MQLIRISLLRELGPQEKVNGMPQSKRNAHSVWLLT